MIRITKSDLTRLLMAMGLGVTLSGCFLNKDLPPLEVGEIDLGHPEKDRPPVSGNTLDQFNSLKKYAPYAVNINVSYEFSLLATNIEEDVDDHFWMFKGRMKDNQHTYTQIYLMEEQEG
ncbi:MAG: hypothetical protein R3261_09925, partial [Alphaproteobacteria bacterium]|nr:hypothetical protein [Alphaproteobacteria bacterium]